MVNGNIPHNYNTFRMAGYCKALITLLKYCPQVYLNYCRKSTIGWSIFNILLDFTGGVFSITQEVIDLTYLGMTTGEWDILGNKGDTFNIVKFFLGVISIFFDVVFMIQHWILYPEKAEETIHIDLPKRSDSLSVKEPPTAASIKHRQVRTMSSISTINSPYEIGQIINKIA
jgi:hypothetical protein